MVPRIRPHQICQVFYRAIQKSLQEQHPLIYDKFQKGNFTVKQSRSKFNCLLPDQVIEQTVNKEQKGPGSIIGLSMIPEKVNSRKTLDLMNQSQFQKICQRNVLWLTRSQSTHATSSSVPGSTLLKRAMLSLGFRQSVQHQRISRTIFLMQKTLALAS